MSKIWPGNATQSEIIDNKTSLTLRRLRCEIGADVFFQMVGTAPGFKRLARPFMGYARVKQSFVKWSEQTGNFPTGPGLKFFR